MTIEQMETQAGRTLNQEEICYLQMMIGEGLNERATRYIQLINNQLSEQRERDEMMVHQQITAWRNLRTQL